MAKFSGYIGFVKNETVRPGVVKNVAIEKHYRGDLSGMTFQWESSGQVNDNVDLDNTLTIVADSYMLENFYAIRYVKMRDAAWRVTRVRERYPRLVLTIGGLYNGETASTSG